MKFKCLEDFRNYECGHIYEINLDNKAYILSLIELGICKYDHDNKNIEEACRLIMQIRQKNTEEEIDKVPREMVDLCINSFKETMNRLCVDYGAEVRNFADKVIEEFN